VFLSNLKKVIEENMSEPGFGIDQLAKELSSSKTQLYRKLKAVTGMRINQFVKQIKLHHATLLLKEGHLTVAEVTYEVGFSDLKYFRKSFKKEFGANPSEILKKG
jgi:AraC-like DNA-binding protein